MYAIKVDSRGSNYGYEQVVLNTVTTAANENRSVLLAYGDGEGNVSVRRVQPYEVSRSKNREFLLRTFDLNKGQNRDFRVDRILSADLGEVLPQSAEDKAVDVARAHLLAFSVDMAQYTGVATLKEAFGVPTYTVKFEHSDGQRIIRVVVRKDEVPGVATLSVD